MGREKLEYEPDVQYCPRCGESYIAFHKCIIKPKKTRMRRTTPTALSERDKH